MNKKSIIFVIVFACIVFLSAFCQAATQVPSPPLKGMAGLKEAIAIQAKTKKPIILWSTWDTCPNCATVSKWFAGQTAGENLKNYPRVILSSRGGKDEMKESEKMGFTGGNFYIIYDYSAKHYKSVWAWEQGTYTIKGDLLDQLKSLAEQP